jgi:hypothetical protein
VISSVEALQILRRWCAAGDQIKLVSAISELGFSGKSLDGLLADVAPEELTFISGDKKIVVSLIGTTFRRVPRQDLVQESSSWNWSENLEIRWSASGNFLLLLKLSAKQAPYQRKPS